MKKRLCLFLTALISVLLLCGCQSVIESLLSGRTVEVTEITLPVSELTLSEGENTDLTATVLPADATDPSVQWKTSDSQVAIVSKGKVYAVGKGTATVTAETTNGKKAEVTVTVTAKTVEVSSVDFPYSVSSFSMEIDEYAELTVTVSPDNAADKTVRWSTSDSSVVTVDDNGTVMAVGNGTATVTAETANGKKATITVVVGEVEVTDISFPYSVSSFTMKVDEYAELEVELKPGNASDRTVRWKTSEKNVATVSKGIVTAVGKGTAVITAEAANGKKATISVTVQSDTVEVRGLSLSPKNMTLTEGQTAELTAVISPEDATDRTVKWSSSDRNVATVSKGTVTAIGKGTATITAEASNGKKAEVSVTVKEKTASSSGTTAPFYYYSLLSPAEKAAYDALAEAAADFQTKVSLKQYGFSLEEGEKIYDAFMNDRIDLFQLANTATILYGKDRITDSIKFEYVMDREGYASAVKEMKALAEDVRKQTKKLSSEREKVLFVYDLVKDRLEYGGTSAEHIHNTYFAYTDRMGVCEAYSKLFGYLLGEIGIESIQVSGNSKNDTHRWTMAKIDGKWYHFDVTWDDSDPEHVSYDYFAVTDDRIRKDHTASRPELLPKADSTDANFFVFNGLVLKSLEREELEAIARKAYQLTGEIVFSCPDKLYHQLLSDTDRFWILIHAVDSSVHSLNYVYNEAAEVLSVAGN